MGRPTKTVLPCPTGVSLIATCCLERDVASAERDAIDTAIWCSCSTQPAVLLSPQHAVSCPTCITAAVCGVQGSRHDGAASARSRAGQHQPRSAAAWRGSGGGRSCGQVLLLLPAGGHHSQDAQQVCPKWWWRSRRAGHPVGRRHARVGEFSSSHTHPHKHTAS